MIWQRCTTLLDVVSDSIVLVGWTLKIIRETTTTEISNGLTRGGLACVVVVEKERKGGKKGKKRTEKGEREERRIVSENR